MSQTTIQKHHLPSTMLREAYYTGLKKITGRLFDNQGGYCALGAILKLNEEKIDFNTFDLYNQAYNILSIAKYGVPIGKLKPNEYVFMTSILKKIIIKNDTEKATFLEIGEYLEEQGL